MKRSNSGGQGGPNYGGGVGGGDRGGGPKRPRNNADSYAEALAAGNFEFRFLIPSKCAGAVIGRGGEKIKAVREKYNATLTVPDKNTHERVFTAIVSQDSLADCFREILQHLTEFKEFRNKKEEMEIRMLIHQSMAGAIIGKGGSKIKELREQVGAQLKVYSECAPNSTDRVFLISGPQEKLPDAVKQLVDYMKEIPVKGPTRQYDAANYDPNLAATYGGYEGGRPGPGSGAPSGGPPMRGGGDGPPSYDRPPYDAYNAGRGTGGPSGPPPYGGNAPTGGYGDYRNPGGYGVAASSYGASAVPPPAAAPPSYGRSGFSGGPPVASSGSFATALPQDASAGVTTTQVTIPEALCGTIIGKGGDRINRIRQESGARIELGEGTYGVNERIISITGTPHQIQSAQYHLQQSVRTSEQGRKYLSQQQR